LVIAGAGSGKTRTLTYRTVRLVEKGVPPGTVLLLTFTRKAAAEMLQRASQLLDARCRQIAGGTFHSFCHLLCKQYAKPLGIDPSFTIADRADTHHLISMVKKEQRTFQEPRSFPRPKTLAQIFSRAANKEMPVERIIETDFPHLTLFMEAIASIRDAYIRQKARLRFLDYDDLLLFGKRLLLEHAEIRKRVSAAYRFIMVDEYQDTNPLQAGLLYLLAETHHNIMAVGDDSQSIYAFRGASFRNIMDFPQRFPGTRLIRLEENYRSVQPILTVANAILEKAEERYPKHLFTQKDRGVTPCLIRAEDENTQSRFVAEKVRALNRGGVPLDQMAVLFRASFHSFDLEIELKRAGIPFIKVGGYQFSESAHMKDFLAFFKILLNPYDQLGWLRILMLLKGVGVKTAEQIFQCIQSRQAGLDGFCSLEETELHSRAVASLQALYRNGLNLGASLSEAGESVMRYYLPLLRENYEDHPKRARELEQLLAIMDRYASLDSFLADMALEPPNTSADSVFYLPEAGTERLTLSTIHSAKGLEWHTVFILHALEGRFPSFQSTAQPEVLEEELRLMYVAVTRAKENLFLLYPENIYDRSSGTILDQPSQFLQGIPKRALRKQAAWTRHALKRPLRPNPKSRFSFD